MNKSIKNAQSRTQLAMTKQYDGQVR